MDIEDLKQIPLTPIVTTLGGEHAHDQGNDRWFYSPFRPDETHASFKIDSRRNIWYDFGEGRGGSIIDLLIALLPTVTSPGEALREGAKRFGGQTFSDTDPTPPHPRTSTAPLKDPATSYSDVVIKPLTSYPLKDYLIKRGINPTQASNYVQEMHYSITTLSGNQKRYSALAFPDQAGGFELRNRYFKGTYGPKTISILPGTTPDPHTISIFEGFIDFLSMVTCRGHPPEAPALVMNGTALIDQTVTATASFTSLNQVHCYLDRDEAGHSTLANLRNRCPGYTWVDQSALYEGFQDLNAWWQHHQQHQARQR